MSDYAVAQGIALARVTGARVTGLHVLPAFHWFSIQMDSLQDSREQFSKEVRVRGDNILDKLTSAATQAGVPCDSVAMDHEHVYEAIVDVALSRGCDLIVMASHGRRRLHPVLLGSETHKVLTHSSVPVLVLHPPRQGARSAEFPQEIEHERAARKPPGV